MAEAFSETIATDRSDEIGYAIEIERLRARVGNRDVFDEVGLRTTTVCRREGADWKLVNRHVVRLDAMSPRPRRPIAVAARPRPD